MSRCIFLWTLATLFLAAPANSEAQSERKMPRIGHLLFTSASGGNAPLLRELRAGLHDLGYVEGKNLAIEIRSAESKLDRLPELAAELVKLNVDVLLAGGTPPIQAARRATSTIPLVMTQGPDPVASGFVASLARPGGNITGLTSNLPGLSGKRLELLKESFPSVARVGLLWESGGPNAPSQKKDLDSIARSLEITLHSVDVSEVQHWDETLSTLKRQGVGALLMLGAANLFGSGVHSRISDFTLKNRLPTMWVNCRPPELGDLMCYSPNIGDLYRRAAVFVDKILKGAKPAELPVEQPMKLEFIVNLKTAKQIGVTIPANVLVRADRVIR